MQDRSNTGLLGCFSKLPVIVIELYRILGYFFIGALGCLLTTELAKYKIHSFSNLTETMDNIPYMLYVLQRGFWLKFLEEQDRISASAVETEYSIFSQSGRQLGQSI